MPIISFSQRDILRGTIVTPSWYRVNIENVGESLSADGDSINYPVEGVILFNSDNGDKQFAGVPLDWRFNSKAKGFAVGFLRAFGVEVTVGPRFDLSSAIGREVDIFVENDTYKGRIINSVNHKYRTPRDVAVVA